MERTVNSGKPPTLHVTWGPLAYALCQKHITYVICILVSHTSKRSAIRSDRGAIILSSHLVTISYQPLVKGNEDARYEGAPERRCSRTDISLGTLRSKGAVEAHQKVQPSMWWDSFGRQTHLRKLIMEEKLESKTPTLMSFSLAETKQRNTTHISSIWSGVY